MFPGPGAWHGHNAQVVAVALAAPTVFAAVVTLALRSARAARWPGLLATAGTAAAVTAAIQVIGSVPPDAGMGLALMAYPGIAVSSAVAARVFAGWQRPGAGGQADRERAPAAGWRAGLAVPAAVGVVLTAGVIYGGWWYPGLFADSATSPATAPAHPSGPPGKLLWTVAYRAHPDELDSSFGRSIPVPAGGLVAADGQPAHDIVVRDLATGRQRWHYSRSDLQFTQLATAMDGRTVVASYWANQDSFWLVGLDAATGQIRWQHQMGDGDGHLALLPGMVAWVSAASSEGPEDMTAYDPGTGSRMWTRRFAAPCDLYSTTESGPALTAVLAPCRDSPSVKHGGGRADVQAVSPSGRLLWTARASTASATAVASASTSLLAVNPDAVLVRWAYWSRPLRVMAAIDPGTGKLLWSIPSTLEQYLAIGDHVVLTEVERNGTSEPRRRDALRLRDAASGNLRAGQPAAHAIPPGWQLAGPSATISGGRGYLVIARHDQVRLVALDLASGRVLGSYPVPSGATASDAASEVSASVQAGDGVALVVVSGHNETVLDAIRVP